MNITKQKKEVLVYTGIMLVSVTYYPHFKRQYQQQLLLPIKHCELTILIFTTHTFLYGRMYILILPEEYEDDLGSCLPWGKQTFHS